MEQVALVVMAVRPLECHAARNDAGVKAFQLAGLLAHARLDGRRRIEITERDLEGPFMVLVLI